MFSRRSASLLFLLTVGLLLMPAIRGPYTNMDWPVYSAADATGRAGDNLRPGFAGYGHGHHDTDQHRDGNSNGDAKCIAHCDGF